MTNCSHCQNEIDVVDLDILEETEELQGEPNARQYECPHCESILRIYIKVDLVETMVEGTQ